MPRRSVNKVERDFDDFAERMEADYEQFDAQFEDAAPMESQRMSPRQQVQFLDMLRAYPATWKKFEGVHGPKEMERMVKSVEGKRLGLA